ncbi:MAG: hypothetical protein MUE42_11875 [Opitutaceae bacterium]|jgi:hypothetical protein|nr:hypothetical protein [Opitutaceae bacterium]
MPLRVTFFNPWARQPEDASAYLARLPGLDLSAHLPPGADARLRAMARLDCDWYGECARCFAALGHPTLRFLPAHVVGPSGLSDFASAATRRPPEETWWLLFMAHHPHKVGPALGPLCDFLRKQGVRIAYYAFDEASREMPCFAALAPHLDILIHDEFPLGPAAAGLRPDCLTLHRSWVANLVPFDVPFEPAPENKIVFLGSELGLTPHRRRQLDHLRAVFKDRLVAHHDHSVPVGARAGLARYAVGFCPEGRKFTTPAMARTHTDRPFWSGCLGLVPVSENSREGGRLDALAQAGLLERYPHGDLDALVAACERALAASTETRRRIHQHYNRHETVGSVLAPLLAAHQARA